MIAKKIIKGTFCSFLLVAMLAIPRLSIQPKCETEIESTEIHTIYELEEIPAVPETVESRNANPTVEESETESESDQYEEETEESSTEEETQPESSTEYIEIMVEQPEELLPPEEPEETIQPETECFFLETVEPEQETESETVIEQDCPEIPQKTEDELFSEEVTSIQAQDHMQWYMEYKSVVLRHDQNMYIPTIYDAFSQEELSLMFSVVQAEIGDEWSFDNKANVASVILNRVDSPLFPNSLSGNLNGEEFSSISDGRYATVQVSQTTILACEYAYSFRTTDCLFFDSNQALASKYNWVFHDGAHNFYSM